MYSFLYRKLFQLGGFTLIILIDICTRMHYVTLPLSPDKMGALRRVMGGHYVIMRHRHLWL